MLNPVDKNLNLKNLKDILEIIPESFDCFIFWGTLLGYGRNNGIIEYDDDIDFLCDVSHREELLDILGASDFSTTINRDCFVQAHRMIAGVDTYIDFYFFENNDEESYLLDYWSHTANCHKSPGTGVKHPKKLLYPFETREYDGVSFKVPVKLEEVCEYMYGKHWRVPLRKRKEYTWKVVNSIPQVSVIGSGLEKVKNHEE